MKTKIRNGSIEVYRCTLMFGICLLHTICQGGYVQRGLSDVLLSCVDGFVFISGYFGISFSYKKMFNLALVGLICSVWSVVIDATLFDSGWGGILIKIVHAYVNGFWFLWAYLILMMFSPVVAAAIENCKADRGVLIRTFLPVLLLVFGWMYLDHMPIIGNYVPTPKGFGVLSFLCLLGIYVFARLFRVLDWERFLTWRRLIGGLLVCIAGAAMGFGHYYSLFAVGLSACSFVMFKRLKFPALVAKVAMVMAPSMFAVYLLHSSGYGFRICWNLTHFFVVDCGIPHWIAWFITSAVIFVGGVAIDSLRRFARIGV